MYLVKPWSQGWLIAAGAYPGFCSMKRLEVGIGIGLLKIHIAASKAELHEITI